MCDTEITVAIVLVVRISFLSWISGFWCLLSDMIFVMTRYHDIRLLEVVRATVV